MWCNKAIAHSGEVVRYVTVYDKEEALQMVKLHHGKNDVKYMQIEKKHAQFKLILIEY